MTDPAGLHDFPSEARQPDGVITRVLEICNKRGLHARASAKFVQTVEKFDADVRVMRCGEVVGGTSIMGLMMLAASPGTTITVEATGNRDKLDALIRVLEPFGIKELVQSGMVALGRGSKSITDRALRPLDRAAAGPGQ